MSGVPNDLRPISASPIWQNPKAGPVDLLLGQCDAAERDELRRRVGDDPSLALELAETVALFEQFRQVAVVPSAEFAGKLAEIVGRAQRRVPPPRAPIGRNLMVAAAAAAVTLVALSHWDPLAHWRTMSVSGGTGDELALPVAQGPGSTAPTVAGADSERERSWQSSLDTVRQRLGVEQSSRLRDAFEDGLQAKGDALSQWLDPRNSLVLLQLDHELRASAAVRRKALSEQGGLAAVDDRVQELADQLAVELLPGSEADKAGSGHDLDSVSLALRAVLAAGPGGAGSAFGAGRARAVAVAGGWLAAHLPSWSGGSLVTGLSALLEVAAVTNEHVDDVTLHGRRLLDELLAADDENWSRRRPDLLNGHVAANTIGDAGRLLQRLPGFGLDVTQCDLGRRLLLAQLRERRDRGHDGPEIVAALLFGGADLLGKEERAWNEFQLQRWQPARLVPDFVTVQQLAWSLEPGRHGFTRLQGQLRQLALLPAPTPMRDRAAFCLCLATDYAAFGGDNLRRFAAD